MLLNEAILQWKQIRNCVIVRRDWEFTHLVAETTESSLMRVTETPHGYTEQTFVPTVQELLADDWEVLMLT